MQQTLHQKPTTILPNTIRLSMRFSVHHYTSAGDTIQDTNELRRFADGVALSNEVIERFERAAVIQPR